MKNLLNQAINLLFFIVGLGLTIYNFTAINIAILSFPEFSKNPDYFDAEMFVVFYIPIILLITIVVIFWRNIYKKTISKNYFYGYIIFLMSCILYYIFVFNNAKVEYIPKENFHTINHNEQFNSDDNAYNLINNFDPQFKRDISNMTIHCLSDDKCTQEQKQNTKKITQEYISNNMDTYLQYIDELNNITQKNFIKSDNDYSTFLKISGIISLINFQKVIDTYYIKNNQFDEIIMYYENTYKFSNLLLNSDVGLTSFIIGISIREKILENFTYLIENNSITDSQKSQINNLIEKYKIIEPKLIYENMIKGEYGNSFNIDAKVNNSMILNFEEFLNFRRYALQKQYIRGEELEFSSSKLPFTQVGIYNLLYSDFGLFQNKESLLDIIKKESEFVGRGGSGDY